MKQPEKRDPAGAEPITAAQRYSPRPLTDGELWTAETLLALRRRGYRLGAWLAFLSSSLERSARSAHARPVMVRQARAWGAGGGAAWLAACAATRGHPRLQLRTLPGLWWWLAVWRMLDWHLGMAEGGDGRARERLSPADAITLGRFWLVPVAPGAAHSSRGLPAVIVLGGLTDWLDGNVARRRGRTRLGRDLDTFADLFFLLSATAAAHSADRVPLIGTAAVAARHGAGLAVGGGAVLGRARRPAIRARRWGALLRFGGLALATAGARRTGTAALVAGCLVTPKPTVPQLSLA